MVLILKIPPYYRSTSYVLHYNRHPTTTAQYILLTPASSETLTTRNAAIAKDCVAWGWRLYNTDRSLPKMEKWFAKYEKLAKKNTWDDDIWVIWQREHGLRINGEDEKKKAEAEAANGKSRLGSVVWGKDTWVGSDELRLRVEHGPREEKRMRKWAEEQMREMPGLHDPFSDVHEVIGENDEYKDEERLEGGLRGGGADGAGAKATTGGETEALTAVVLPRHSWLSRG
ncbi:hypothetical protein J4E85_000662 [Alternaria conjuncta]|uniref:uncharacterized protein n=1 Tax=Alternaria conjuncta TaxID=181017 RepID=UPI00221F040A|nr:uncharacterized protein J4E85_000662 [Alternaria conjuncta]KAI4938223.1 hypothetical protein J4E85_000662 [Alternaria conjuncta]